MGKLKALVISASPLKKSFSYDCAAAFLRGVSPSITVKIEVSRLGIKPCAGCLKCRGGECRFKDGFKSARKKIISADFIVTASPVYFMGVPSQFKAFIDRHQQYWRPGKRKKTRKGFIILTAGSGSKKVFSGAEQEIRAMHAVNGIETIGVMRIGGTDSQVVREKALKAAASRGISEGKMIT
jgi:multimeric flavodoxin WrbA